MRGFSLLLRKFVIALILPLMAFFILKVTTASARPEHITLTWMNDTGTTQTIMWQTEFTTAAGSVEFAEVRNDRQLLPQKVECVTAEVQGVAANTGTVSIHYATLTGLKPGTRYIYRVGDGVSWSKPNYFTTAAANNQPFKFLVFGDSQSINYLTWRTTLHTAYQANNDAAFFINIGDLVDVGQDKREWDAWFKACEGVIDNIPVIPVVGNHETYTLQKTYSMPDLFTAQFKMPNNGPEGLKGQVYSFDYGNMHFSVLDSQVGEEREFAPDMLEKQRVWLDDDLKNTNKFWKIVLIHRPLYHNRAQDSDGDLREAFIPIIEKYNVDIVFSGHDHVYARSFPLKGGVGVSRNEGTIYVTAGRSGTKTYRQAQAKSYNEVFYNPTDEANYMTVENQGKTIVVRVYKCSGGLIDEWIVNK